MFAALKAQNNIAHGKQSDALGTLPRNVGALQGQLKTALRVALSARYNVGWRHYTQRDVRCALSALGYIVSCAFSAFLSNMYGCPHLTNNIACLDVARRVSTLRTSYTTPPFPAALRYFFRCVFVVRQSISAILLFRHSPKSAFAEWLFCSVQSVFPADSFLC